MTVARLLQLWPEFSLAVRQQLLTLPPGAPVEIVELVNRTNSMELTMIIHANGERQHVSLGTLAL